MRFSTRRPAPNYLARREQRRLLTLVLLLGLVVFLMHQASKPASWSWFMLLSNQPVPGPAAAPMDTKLQPAVETVAVAGAFTSPQEPEAAAPLPGDRFPGVRPELLNSVKDDTVFRSSEHQAFFHLLEILHDSEAATLEAASLGPVAFAQLYQQPAEYRGKLVGIRGTVRRVSPITAAKNDYGIETYYQVWMQPSDNPSFPLVIYTLELPEGFPIAESVREDVELTGFFFKRWAYRAQDAIRSAPLLLAKTVKWDKPVAAKNEPINVTLLIGTVACALLAAGIVVYMARQGGSAAYSGARPAFQIGGHTRNEPSPDEILKALAERAEADSAAAAEGPGPGNRGPTS